MDIMKKYQKKPVIIDAVKLTKENIADVVTLTKGTMHNRHDGSFGVDIHTLEGVMQANIGDYIIRGVQGELYPCKPDIFKTTYTRVK